VTDIFEEVDESLRQDTVLKWWKKALPFLVVGGVIILAGVGFYEFMRWQRSEEVSKQALAYDTALTALQKKDLPAAKTAFAQLANGQGGFASLSSQMLAGVEKDLTNDTAAVQQHLSVAAAKDKGVLGDIALLKLAYSKADSADLAEIEKTVAPLVAKGGYAGALARELVAAKALASGQIDRARADYQALSLDIEAPQAMRNRVQSTLFTIPPAATAAAPAPATTTPAPAPAAPAAPAPAQPGQ
jgi:hypothetical protein